MISLCTVIKQGLPNVVADCYAHLSNSHREHSIALVVYVFTNQVYTACQKGTTDSEQCSSARIWLAGHGTCRFSLPGALANKVGFEPKRSVKPSESQAYRSCAAGVPACA